MTDRTAPAAAQAGDAGGSTASQAGTFGFRLIAPLVIGSLLNPINSTMISTALVPIGRDFHAGVMDTVWLIASLYLTSAVAQPVMGRIAGVLGARRVYLAGLVIVGLAGIAGIAAPSLAFLIGVRAVLGIGTSAAYPAALTILRAHSRRIGRETPRTVLGVLSLAALASAAVGPTLGGLLTDLAGWHAIFVVNAPLAVIGVVLTLLWLPRDPPRAGRSMPGVRLDVVGIGLFTATLVVVLLFLMDLRHPRWWLLPVIAVAGAALGAHSWRRAEAFFDLRMMARNKALTRSYLRTCVAWVLMYCVMYGFAQWLEDGHGFSPSHAGMITLPMSVVAGVCSLLGARTKGIRGPLVLGAVLMLAGCSVLLLLGSGTPALLLVAAAMIFGVPQGLNSTGNQAAVYAQAPVDDVGTAAGLQRTFQYIGAITSSSLIGLFYGNRASDGGLHAMAMAMIVLSALLLVGTLADRTLGRRS
ncbi:MAG: major facilitator superfamily 1 [Streptosporangiaceae bacterium]|nr:major facilitator superfamily 1 [Streptosporangiaceae bacterium]